MLTVWIALTLVGMDDDFEFASSAERVHVEDRADAYCAPCDFGPTHHDMEWSDAEEPQSPLAALRAQEAGSSGPPQSLRLSMLARRDDDSKPSDGRGGYSRDGKGKETGSGYARDAWEHFKQADDFTMGRPCLASCPYGRKCGLQITPAHLMRAHVQMYGTNTTMQEPSEPGGAPTYGCAFSFDKVKEQRVNLVLNSISYSATDTSQTVERFMVASVGPVCAEYCRCAHGVPIGTWNKLLASARAGRLQAGAEWDATADADGLTDEQLHDNNTSGVAMEETIEWWIIWLTLEDQMPNEPVIVHRIVVWDSVHELEYKPDMLWFGTTHPLHRTRWVTLRSVALKRHLQGIYYNYGDR
jgi:hypothetical protein